MREAPPHMLRSVLIVTGLAMCAPVQAMGPGTTSRNDFQTEPEAVHHCAGRPLVWVLPANHRYYHKSDPEYGRGAQGAYMCEDEASGDHNEPARK
jgi:hypothetical protein